MDRNFKAEKFVKNYTLEIWVILQGYTFEKAIPPGLGLIWIIYFPQEPCWFNPEFAKNQKLDWKETSNSSLV